MAKMIIAKKNGAVTDAEKDLAMISSRDCLIDIASGNVDVTTSGGSGSGSYAHGKNYVPSYDVFVRDPDNTGRWFPTDGAIDLGSTTTAFKYPRVQANTSQITFNVSLDPSTPNKTVRFHYIVYANAPDGDIGTGQGDEEGKLRIAKSGQNIKTVTDARQLILNAGENVPKVDKDLVGSGSLNVPAATGGGNGYATKTITHNLGYVPRAYAIETDEGYYLPVDTVIFGGDYAMTYYITSSTLVFQAINYAFSPITLDYKYHILRDKIA